MAQRRNRGGPLSGKPQSEYKGYSLVFLETLLLSNTKSIFAQLPFAWNIDGCGAPQPNYKTFNHIEIQIGFRKPSGINKSPLMCVSVVAQNASISF
jgi:hypothetical protein